MKSKILFLVLLLSSFNSAFAKEILMVKSAVAWSGRSEVIYLLESGTQFNTDESILQVLENQCSKLGGKLSLKECARDRIYTWNRGDEIQRVYYSNGTYDQTSGILSCSAVCKF